MKRILFAAALCAITAISGAWTLQWDSGSNWPAGTTVNACLNGVCVNGVTGNSQDFSASYPAGSILHGTAQAVPPAGYQCGEPLALCPPSSVAEIAQTIPSDQQYPNSSAWVATGGLMAAPTFVAQYATAFNTSTSPKTAMSAVSINSGDILVAVGMLEDARSGGSYAPTYSENGSASFANPTVSEEIDYSPVAAATYTATASESITVTVARGVNANTASYFGANVVRFSGASGIGNIVTGNGSGSPSLSITTSQANSAIVVIFSDWNATTGTQIFTSNGGAGSPTSLTGYVGDGAHYGAAIAYYADAGAAGAKTIGMSAPTGQKWRGIAIEVKGTAGGTTYNYSATGGIATGGTATLKRAFARSASGGVSTGGVATLKRTFANQASGGITTGGAASASKSSGNSYTASGGIATGGSATLKRTQASTANGGISTGGVGGLKLVKTVSGSGGLATGGAAALKRAFAIFASGGLVTGGTAPLKLVKTTTASGGITTGGAATLKRTQATTATGGITTGGAAGLKRTQATTATGGIITGGAATASKSSPGQNSYTASGGVTTGGAATLKRTQTAVGAGGIATGGAAALKRSFARLASGGLSTSGVAVLKQIRAYLASGGVATSGSASVTLTAGAFSYVASGGVSLGGSASVPTRLRYAASGGLTVGGSSLAGYYPISRILPSGRLVVLSKSDRHIVLQRSDRLISLLPSDLLIIPA